MVGIYLVDIDKEEEIENLVDKSKCYFVFGNVVGEVLDWKFDGKMIFMKGGLY